MFDVNSSNAELIRHSFLAMRINYIQTGDVCLSTEDAKNIKIKQKKIIYRSNRIYSSFK